MPDEVCITECHAGHTVCQPCKEGCMADVGRDSGPDSMVFRLLCGIMVRADTLANQKGFAGVTHGKS